jgi:uncharacterized protein (TIGR00730 family)
LAAESSRTEGEGNTLAGPNGDAVSASDHDAKTRLGSYRTGRAEVDVAIEALVDSAGSEDPELVAEMIVSALRLGISPIDRGERKLVNSALKELRYAFGVFDRYHHKRKCSIFGSARTPEDDPAYDTARRLGASLVEHGWMVITGAGPGVMTAGIEGAGAENSFGVNIMLPFEQKANPHIDGDPKLINFRYFFTRKLAFVKESHAFVLLPGGFGTMDEAFEALTLIQTGKSPICPVVLLDPPGGTYWRTWLAFVTDELLALGLISSADLRLFHITDDADEAVAHVNHFYSVFHSMRWVGQRLVLRCNSAITDAALAALNAEFVDIIASGDIVRAEASEPERRDDDVPSLPRLAFRFNRAGLGRLRQLLDALNDSPTLAVPAVSALPA